MMDITLNIQLKESIKTPRHLPPKIYKRLLNSLFVPCLHVYMFYTQYIRITWKGVHRYSVQTVSQARSAYNWTTGDCRIISGVHSWVTSPSDLCFSHRHTANDQASVSLLSNSEHNLVLDQSVSTILQQQTNIRQFRWMDSPDLPMVSKPVVTLHSKKPC
jgi:hypothetical protein